MARGPEAPPGGGNPTVTSKIEVELKILITYGEDGLPVSAVDAATGKDVPFKIVRRGPSLDTAPDVEVTLGHLEKSPPPSLIG